MTTMKQIDSGIEGDRIYNGSTVFIELQVGI